jgi:hypothetical protein
LSYKAQQVLELIHSNLIGPLPKAFFNGSRYFVVVTDDYTRKSWVYFLKTKDETFGKIWTFKALVETEMSNRIKAL